MRSMFLGLAVSVLALGLAFGQAAIVSSNGPVVLGMSVMALCVLLAFALNWAAAVVAILWQSELFFDLVGALSFLAMLALALVLVPPSGWAPLLVAIMSAIWALRLGTFLFLRIRAQGHDRRFSNIKTKPWHFLALWSLQGAWCSVTLCPALFFVTMSKDQPIGLLFFAGCVLWILGFGIEVIADAQKSAFRRDPEQAGTFIQSGLWARSRHPNYFGEILLWCGVTLLALPLAQGWALLILASPVFVAVLLTRVSGIPLLEHRAQQTWGEQPAYQAYLKRTPKLVPKVW